MSTRLRRSHYIHFDKKWYVPQGGAVLYTLSFSETASYSETLLKSVGKLLSETGDPTETFNKQVGKLLSETGDYGEAISRKVNANYGEVLTITENFATDNTYEVAFTETASFVETLVALFISNPALPFFGRSRRRRRGSLPGGHNV